MSAIKAGLILVVGSTAVTTTYFGVFYIKEDPEWYPLDKDSGFFKSESEPKTIRDDYSGKYAEDYYRLFVGVDEKSGNDGWWDWAFRKKYGSRDKTPAGGFNDKKDHKALREACKSAYKSNTSDVVTATEPSGTNQFKEDQVWFYCSWVGNKPKTLNDVESVEGEDKNKLISDWKSGSGNTGKADLLAIYAKENDGLWRGLNRRYGKEKVESGFFRSSQGKSIKDLCGAAYAKTASTSADENTPSDTDLYKWCSLKGKKSR